MKLNSLFIVAFLFLFACTSEIDSSTYLKTQRNGNVIAGKVQATLLKNVGQAIHKGGPEFAVEFCNLKAASIIDSLNQEYKCTISRVSERNRNPSAALSSAQEKELWETFQSEILNDTVVQGNKNLVFYKPIKMGMSACLKCHGIPESDINHTTQQKLHELYPKDLATGYTLGDFRGLWKIEFVRE